MDHDNNLVVGKGRLFFDRFADGTKTGTGQRYLGNTPGFSLSQSEENLDHFDSDDGIKVKDASVTLSQDTSGSITCDDISSENLALWWLGETSTTVVVAAAGESEDIEGIKLGATYSLGLSDVLPMGPGEIENVSVTIGVTPVLAPGNWEVDLDRGRIRIFEAPEDVTLVEGADITVEYDIVGGTLDQVISSNKSIFGALYFESTNPVGAKRDAFFPYVKLAPDGDYDLKGDDWQQMTFNIEVLKLRAGVERVYWKKVG